MDRTLKTKAPSSRRIVEDAIDNTKTSDGRSWAEILRDSGNCRTQYPRDHRKADSLPDPQDERT